MSRGPIVHKLKTAQPFFDEVWELRKPFEVRRDDRDFQPGDVVILALFDGRWYGNRSCVFRIGYVLRDFAGLKRNFCAFGLLEPDEAALELADEFERGDA